MESIDFRWNILGKSGRNALYDTISWGTVVIPTAIALVAFFPSKNKDKKEVWNRTLAIDLAIILLLYKPVSDRQNQEFQDSVFRKFKISNDQVKATDSQVVENLKKSDTIISQAESVIKTSNTLLNYAMETEYPLFPSTLLLWYNITYPLDTVKKYCPNCLIGSSKTAESIIKIDPTPEMKNLILGDMLIHLWFEKDTSSKAERGIWMFDNAVWLSPKFQTTSISLAKYSNNVRFFIYDSAHNVSSDYPTPMSGIHSIPDLANKYFRLELPTFTENRVKLDSLVYKTSNASITFKAKKVGIKNEMGGPRLNFISRIEKNKVIPVNK